MPDILYVSVCSGRKRFPTSWICCRVKKWNWRMLWNKRQNEFFPFLVQSSHPDQLSCSQSRSPIPQRLLQAQSLREFMHFCCQSTKLKPLNGKLKDGKPADASMMWLERRLSRCWKRTQKTGASFSAPQPCQTTTPWPSDSRRKGWKSPTLSSRKWLT